MNFRRAISNFGACVLCGIFIAPVAAPLFLNAQEKEKLPPTPASLPPPLPVFKAPIEYFRELLALAPADRERALAERVPEQRKILLAKFKEYESMSAEERELRLAVTELRWYLMPLMKAPQADRAERLNEIPAEKRPLVEDRLQRWDALSASQQKEFLDNEMTVHYFLRLQSSAPEQKTNLLQDLPPARRQKVEKELEGWRLLPAEQRERMCNRFQEFFELNPKEKQKTLGALSEQERAQMERTLQKFQQLQPEQRRHCIRSFSKFASMSLPERNEFLKKAEMWQNMSSTDRKAWRELVNKLPQMPPLPPGLKFPPLPPSPQMATNFPR